MSVAKLNLSKREKSLLTNADFFYAKNSVTHKLYEQLAQLVNEAVSENIFTYIPFPEGTDFINGKISKGENYLGLPYCILDFPRYFSKEKILAIRTMIWWGKFYSNTVIIGGELVSAYREKFIINKKWLDKREVHWSIGESPWHHHFEAENMIPVKSISLAEFKQFVRQAAFLKVARKNDLKNIDELIDFSLESFRIFAKVLSS